MPYPLLLHSRHHPQTEYEPLAEWLVPWHFGRFEHEYKALTQGAGLVDLSTQALIVLSGSDRTDFLQRILSQELRDLKFGHGREAALLTAKGKIVTILTVLAFDDAFWLLCPAPHAQNVAKMLEQYHFGEDLKIDNQERSRGVLAVKGPQVLEFVRGLTTELNSALDHAAVQLGPLRAHLVKAPDRHKHEFWLLPDAQETAALWSWIQDQGIPAAGWQAYNTVRIEEGAPWMDVDFDETHLLPETGLTPWLISETKGCYVGQEVVTRMLSYGSASKRLMGIQINGNQTIPPGAPVYSDENPIGSVTSAAFSPPRQKVLALGMIKRGHYDKDKSVQVMVNEKPVPAVLCEAGDWPAKSNNA